MQNIEYPINGFKNAHEVLAESERTGKPVRDLIGKGLLEDWSQDKLIEAYLREECSEGYVVQRLKISRLRVREIMKEKGHDGAYNSRRSE